MSTYSFSENKIGCGDWNRTNDRSGNEPRRDITFVL